MITKFNLFENKGIGQRHWKVLIDDFLFVSLDKIGMPEEIQNDLYDHYCDLQDNADFKFVMVGEDNYSENSDWYWDFNQNRKNNEFLEFYADTEGKYEYQGVVEVTQDEIDDWKLKKAVNKYNL
jgi:hypothetical protein